VIVVYAGIPKSSVFSLKATRLAMIMVTAPSAEGNSPTLALDVTIDGAASVAQSKLRFLELDAVVLLLD
jgi:hypothetical protein